MVPVGADAFVAATSCTKCTVVNVEAVLGRQSELETSFYAAIQGAERKFMGLEEPWLRSFIGMEFHTSVIHVLAWDRLLGLLRSRTHGAFELHPPAAFCVDGSLRKWGWDYRTKRAFWLCVDAMERKGLIRVVTPCKACRYRSVRLYAGYAKAVVASLLGWLVLHKPVLFQRREVRSRSCCEDRKTTVLLAGIQHGDAVHQAPFAERLYAKFGDGFAWLSFLRPAEAGMTPDEMALLTSCPNRQHYWINADSQPRVAWINSFVFGCVRDYCAIRITRVLTSCFETSLSRSDWRRWYCQSECAELVSEYNTWAQCLDRLSPTVIVGFSTIQGMAFVRAWSKVRRVPFLLLPHGIVTRLFTHVVVDGDDVGVYGAGMAEQVARSGLSLPERIEVCGSLQFGAKRARLSSPMSIAEASSFPRSALYLVGFGTPLFPATPGMRFREIEGVHRACLQSGYRLVVREHPRGGKDEYKPFVLELNRRVPNSVTISEEPALSNDLSRASVVVASEYDGAFVDALMSNSYVIGYASVERQQDEAVTQFSQLGSLARTPADLERLMRLAEDKVYGQAMKDRRQEFLARLMGDDLSNPWSRAEMMVDRVVNEARHA